MSKNKFKKIPISEFISDKKLSKILSIIEKSDDVETNYDRIEMLLDDDYDAKDLGTNRLVLTHKKSKYKDLIFKVAGDSHGIEANYREFYNGDLDKRLTFSYSISKDGTFIVQERVKPMTRDLMKKHKKEVREMLTKLSKKILLVDCKLENFKNFGIRNNGDICLLDHGDTVPLPNYQGNDIVNVNEESFVSLRCKKPEEMSAGKKNLKACGGKLKYSKNFDYLICEECGGVCTVNDAYREFYGDKSIKIKGNIGLDLEDSFDPDEWKAHIQKYCIETMSHADNKLNNEGEEITMKTKTIKNRNCVQVKGFWLPEPTGDFAEFGAMYTAVKMGATKPQKYLEKLGLEIDDYKVYPSEHTPSEKNKKITKNEHIINEYGFDILAVRDKIIEKIISIGQYQSQITYIECAKIAPEVDFSNIRNIQGIREVISSDRRTAGCVYNDEGFSVRLSERYIIVDTTEKESDVTISNNEHEERSNKSDNSLKDIMASGYVHVEDIKNKTNNDSIDMLDFVTTSSSDNVEYINSMDIAKEYANNNDTTIVDDYKNEYTRPTIVFSYSELEENTIDYNGVKCVVINKYAVPIDIIYRYSNDDGFYELPSTKMKALLKANGLHPKKYKVTNSESVDDTDSEVLDITSSPVEIDETLKKYSPSKNDEDSNIFMDELKSFAERYADEHPDAIDKFGTIEIPASEIIVECLLNHAENGEIVEILSDVCDIEYDDENISISLDDENITILHRMICDCNGSGVDISCNYINATIGILINKYKPTHKTDAQKYSEHISSVIKSCTVDGDLDLTNEIIPIRYLDPSLYFDEDLTDPISEKHKIFNDIVESLDDIFTVFYNSYDDTDLISLDNFKDTDKIDELDHHYINVCNNYKYTKQDIFTNCKSLEDFYSYMNSDIFGRLIVTAHAMVRSTDINDDVTESYNILTKFSDSFMKYLEEIEENYDDNDSSESDAYDVNSYIDDNNTNNNEENVINDEELNNEEDDILSEKILDAILKLTDSINNNNEIISKQNDLMTIKLNSLDNKLDDVIKNITSMDNEKACDEITITNTINNSNDDIVMLSEKDLNKKIIAVNVNNMTVCFDILELAKKATIDAEGDYLSVTDVITSNL